MKRRGFLKFMAAAPVAAPVAAQEAAKTAMLDLGMSGGVLGGGVEHSSASVYDDGKDWHKKALANILKQGAAQINYERRRYRPNGLDPDIASLHSFAWHAKVRMNRDVQFDRWRKNEIEHHRGGILGWWSWD